MGVTRGLTTRGSDRTSSRGAILIHVAIGMVMLIGFTAFVIDYGILWVARGQAVNAADAAAHAAGIALAYDDLNDKTSNGPAKQSAMNVALAHRIWGAPPSISFSDITFPPCPDGLGTCVRVDVFRDASHGNPLPAFLGPIYGVHQQNVRGTSTAEVKIADVAEPASGDCMKPWGIPDKWVENYPTSKPWQPDYLNPKNNPDFDLYNSGWQPLANPDVYTAPSDTGPGTGYQMPADKGFLLVMNWMNAGASHHANPGNFWGLKMTNSGTFTDERERYQANISGCTSQTVTIGDRLSYQPTDLGKWTERGLLALVAQDPSASWNSSTKSPQGGCASHTPPDCPGGATTSPRVVTLGLFDVNDYEAQRKAGVGDDQYTFKIVNIVGGFVEAPVKQSSPYKSDMATVAVHLMAKPGSSSGNPQITESSSFLKTVVLIR